MRARTVLGGGAAVGLLIWALVQARPLAAPDIQQTIDQKAATQALIPAGAFSLQAPGEFLEGGTPVAAPHIQAEIDVRRFIMKRLVTQSEYAACVEDGGCRRLDKGFRHLSAPDYPAIGVSWQDATDYATWVSRRTGQRWRLPDYAEWVRAAAERYREEGTLAADPNDPSVRWLAEYERESERKRLRQKQVQPIGHFGENSLGLLDVAGNVWEWTNTCFTRQQRGAQWAAPIEDCSVRFLAGAHRAAMADFIRDPRSGACSVGMPPSNLGFRLVREG